MSKNERKELIKRDMRGPLEGAWRGVTDRNGTPQRRATPPPRARNPHKAERSSSPGGDRAPPELPWSDRAPPGATELPRGPRRRFARFHSPMPRGPRPAESKRRVSTKRAAKSTLPLRSPSEIDPRARYPAMKSNRPASKKSRACGHVTRCRCQCRDSTNASHIHNGDAAKQHG